MKKLLITAFLTVGLITVVGGNLASAHGWFSGFINAAPEQIVERQTQMFAQQADMLGIDILQVKNYWAQGKSMPEIIEELGIDQEQLQVKMREQRQLKMQEQLQILVDSGVISQEQANNRLQFMQDKMANSPMSGKGFGRGFGRKGGCFGGF